MNRETYDDFSQDYDRFVNWEARFAAEMPFIEEELRILSQNNVQVKVAGTPCWVYPRGGCRQADTRPTITTKVLDAACGTGMHAIELARRGFTSAGADLSPRMVERARANAASAGVEVLFKPAGFGELHAAFHSEPRFPFDALLCLGNSLPHMTSPEGIRSALKDFAACLRPGGVLILQNRNFDAVMKHRERWIAPQSRCAGGEEWLFLRFYDFDPDGLITFNIVRLQREVGGEWQQQVSSVRLYPLLRAELEELLGKCGFRETRFFGKMEREPFRKESSENLVAVATRA